MTTTTPAAPSDIRTVRVGAALWSRARAKAQRNGDNLSAILRETLRQYVEADPDAGSSVQTFSITGDGNTVASNRRRRLKIEADGNGVLVSVADTLRRNRVYASVHLNLGSAAEATAFLHAFLHG